MSDALERLLAQATDETIRTVTLSPQSLTVLYYALGFTEYKNNWLEKSDNPLDEVTDEDWDMIQKIVANAYDELLTE